MTDDQDRTAHKLAHFLDLGAAGLRPGTLYRLQQARAAALAGAVASKAPSLALARAGAGRVSTGDFGGWSGWDAPGRWLGVALVVGAFAFGMQQWKVVQQVHEYEEVDLNILASDLPIDAYLDRGFQNWLRTAFDH